jgi:hypothetical protein
MGIPEQYSMHLLPLCECDYIHTLVLKTLHIEQPQIVVSIPCKKSHIYMHSLYEMWTSFLFVCICHLQTYCTDLSDI